MIKFCNFVPCRSAPFFFATWQKTSNDIFCAFGTEYRYSMILGTHVAAAWMCVHTFFPHLAVRTFRNSTFKSDVNFRQTRCAADPARIDRARASFEFHAMHAMPCARVHACQALFNLCVHGCIWVIGTSNRVRVPYGPPSALLVPRWCV